MATALHHFQITDPNTALLLILFFFLTILFLIKLRKRHRFPPGPKGFPIIGNMGMVNKLTHRGLAELSKVYGGLLYLKIGNVHSIAVSTAEMAKEVLKVQDIVFSNRPATIAIRYLTYDRADMAFAHYGPFWRQMRKICVTKVFSRKRAESWASVREEIHALIKFIDSRVSTPINLGEIVLGLTKNITYRAAFGSVSRDGQDEFLKIMQEFSKLFGAFNIADFIPWLGWINGQAAFHRRLEKARTALDGFIDKIIDDHLQKRKNKACGAEEEEEDDMVDELMEFYNEEDEDEGEGEATKSESVLSITRDNIKALIMDVMFGGTETVASAIEWAMAELLKSPDDLKRVQQELASVVGFDRTVQESDLEKLTYLRCVVKETLRLHPPIPLLLHETASETSINGYRIPAGSRVMINAWAIGREPGAWTDPNVFRPARFLEGGPDFQGRDFEFIPFGSGRRSCPGMQLGLYALDLTVANLCHCFNWELPEGMKAEELDMNDVFGLTAPRAVQLVAVPRRRLSCPMSS
ncbi:cytochrome P450 84A1-like [Andrographis paniculata]|uniref:cytochrome P450 84A1-like n=1 Tax=Andrographis paniculata TaxID=175694 RepID=UPI0021E7D8F2|nr:cytochrome P450 84A1-like [Andrographis paniculata]